MARYLLNHPLVLCIGLGLSLLACGVLDNQKPPEKDKPSSAPSVPPRIANKAPITPTSQLECEAGTSLTYANFGEAFMLNYCSQCHSQYLTTDSQRLGAPSELNFDTPNGVISWRSKILAVAALDEDNTMPPGREVPPAERLRLREWLQCGAPGGGDQIHPE